MFETTKTVKSAGFKKTDDGKKEYLYAVLIGEDGKEGKQAIFDPNIQKVVQEAFKTKSKLIVKMEKEGNFWNIKEAQIGTLEPPVSPTGEKPVSSERTYGKSKDEQESIKRQSARRDAVEIYKHCTSPEQPFGKAGRELFEEIFGIMLLMGDPVVAEAVKLGGKIEK